MKQACDFLSDEAQIAPGFTLSSAECRWCLLRAFQAVSLPVSFALELQEKEDTAAGTTASRSLSGWIPSGASLV